MIFSSLACKNQIKPFCPPLSPLQNQLLLLLSFNVHIVRGRSIKPVFSLLIPIAAHIWKYLPILLTSDIFLCSLFPYSRSSWMLQCLGLLEAPDKFCLQNWCNEMGGKKRKNICASHAPEWALCLRIRRLARISSLLCPTAEHMLISEAKGTLLLGKRPPMGKPFTFSYFCLKKSMTPTSFIGMLWGFSIRKVRLLNKRHSEKAKHCYLWSSKKYDNIHTDNFCSLRGFFKQLCCLWRLKTSELLLGFCFKPFCSTRTSWLVKLHTDTFVMCQHRSIVPVVGAPDLSSTFSHGKKTLAISTVPCPEMCFHLSKPSQGVWTAWGCRKTEQNYWDMSYIIISHQAQAFPLVSHRQRTPFPSQGSNDPNETDRQFHCV